MRTSIAVLAPAAVAAVAAGPGGALADEDEGIFATVDGFPFSQRPAKHGRLALLRTGGAGARGWYFLAYRAVPPRLSPQYRPFCLALARGDAKPVPREGIEGPVEPSDVYGGLWRCEYPPTFAARLVRRGWQHYHGPQPQPEAGRFTEPHWGITLADVGRVTLRSGKRRVTAELSQPFRLKVPRLPARVRQRIENPRQRRMTAGLPRFVLARAFLGALPYALEQRHGFTVSFKFADGTRVLRRRRLARRSKQADDEPPFAAPHRQRVTASRPPGDAFRRTTTGSRRERRECSSFLAGASAPVKSIPCPGAPQSRPLRAPR
jgi:hypothetical protein